MGGICPHAGYIYSGATAGVLFAAAEVPDVVLLLGPKHHYAGADFAIWPAGAWLTPLGEVPVHEALAADLLTASSLFTADETAHIPEHSLEVILPFIQVANPTASIVPVAVGRASPAELTELADAVARAVSPRRDGVLVVVSSDMTHYEPAEVAEAKDRLALERLVALDAEGLINVVRERDISMCGVWPAAVALGAFRRLGARGGTVLAYTNSGAASGDYRQVVGYAAVAFA